MSRSVDIICTSNWDHEDVEISVVTHGIHGRRLRPGEGISIPKLSAGGDEVRIVVRHVDGAEAPKPFRNEDGDQLIPEARVEWTNVNKISAPAPPPPRHRPGD